MGVFSRGPGSVNFMDLRGENLDAVGLRPVHIEVELTVACSPFKWGGARVFAAEGS